jgi:hypothetical protein
MGGEVSPRRNIFFIGGYLQVNVMTRTPPPPAGGRYLFYNI